MDYRTPCGEKMSGVLKSGYGYPLFFRWNSNLPTKLSTYPQSAGWLKRGLTGTFHGFSSTMSPVRIVGRGLSDTFNMDYRTPFSGVSVTFPWTIGHLDLEEAVMRVRLTRYAYMLYSHSFLIVPVLVEKPIGCAKYWVYENPIQAYKHISQSPLAHVAGRRIDHDPYSDDGLWHARFEYRQGQAGVVYG